MRNGVVEIEGQRFPWRSWYVDRIQPAEPNSPPTPAVTPMARALQKVTLITLGNTLAPPILAARAPRSARETKAAAAMHAMRPFSGTRAAIASGKAAPAAKLQADASAA
jgi:hypothetical protein